MSITLDGDRGKRVALYDASGNPIVFDSSGRLTTIAELNAWDGAADQKVPTLSNGKGTTANNANAAMVGLATWDQAATAYLRLASLRDLIDGANAFDTSKAFAPGAGLLEYNGSNWDRRRNNQEGTALASAARTGTTASPDIVAYNHRGILVYLNVTVNPGGAETLSPEIKVKDPIVGSYTKISSAAASAFGGSTGEYLFTTYPGAPTAPAGGAASAAFQQIIGRTFQINITHSASGSWTYSVAYALIL